jgi:hypothetical protein
MRVGHRTNRAMTEIRKPERNFDAAFGSSSYIRKFFHKSKQNLKNYFLFNKEVENFEDHWSFIQRELILL